MNLLALVGSGEFEVWGEDFERFMLSRATGDGSVVVVPTASAPEGARFDWWARKGLGHYASLGVPARALPVRSRSDAFDASHARGIADASVVYFSGGNAAFLATQLEGTPLWAAVLDLLERGGGVAGCSAGACLIGDFAPRNVTERLRDRHCARGLGLLSGTWVVPHWDALDRHVPGLQEHYLEELPLGTTLVGVDARTSVVSMGDDRWVVFGEGGVLVASQEVHRIHRAGDVFELPSGDGAGPVADLAS